MKNKFAADTCSLVAYFSGKDGADVLKIEDALQNRDLTLPPVVVSELLSDGKLNKKIIDQICALPLMEITEGYWKRAGFSRAKLLTKGLKARIPDSLIAQICIDHNISLITRDTDFKNFQKHLGLKLA